VCACVFCYRNVDKTTGHVKRQHWTPILDSSILPAIPIHPIQSSQTKRRQCSRVEAGPLSAGLTLKWFRAIRCPWLADSHHFSGFPATGSPFLRLLSAGFCVFWGVSCGSGQGFRYAAPYDTFEEKERGGWMC